MSESSRTTHSVAECFRLNKCVRGKMSSALNNPTEYGHDAVLHKNLPLPESNPSVT